MTNIFGTHQENTLAQFREIESRALKAALMADGHQGYTMPVGGVAAYRDEIPPMGVGYDIACGNCAVMTDMKVADLGKAANKVQFMLNKLADDIQSQISFGIGRRNLADNAPVDHELFSSDDWNRIREVAGGNQQTRLFELARKQLGTVGSGNHYVDVFADDLGRIWVGVHFGSRGFGWHIARGFHNMAMGGNWTEISPEQSAFLSLHSPVGQHYWALMELAGRYAYAGREWVCEKVMSVMGAKSLKMVHNHHNFAWKESHPIKYPGDSTEQWEDVIVVRKGATPAFPNQEGFVGGSMGDYSVILRGSTNVSDQVDAMFSTVHGAGRVMGRMEAKGKFDKKTGEVKRAPKVTQAMMNEWIQNVGVIVRGGGVDESPHVYRRLNEVLAAQGDTIDVLHRLRPLIVVMAGEDIYDPYKD